MSGSRSAAQPWNAVVGSWGNKRTAWVSAVAFLGVNGIDLGYVPTVHANMFVRAVGLDHSLEIADVAEWFEVTYELGRARPA